MSGAERVVKKRAKRWTHEQARKVLERWRASGKSASAYAREQGIGETRLWYWAQQFEASDTRVAPQFVAVSVPAIEAGAASRRGLEIDVAGLTVRVGEHIDVVYVARLIAALQESHRC